MAGFDARDSTASSASAEDYTRDLGKPLTGLRIGLPKEFFAEGAAPDVVEGGRGGDRGIQASSAARPSR